MIIYRYRSKYYDPRAGRFLTKDPIGFLGGDVNAYRYVQNNVINWIDPDGLYISPWHFLLSFTSMVVTFHNPITSLITAVGTRGTSYNPPVKRKVKIE
jgi:uncharacterized protein RhaS with RHS repeats